MCNWAEMPSYSNPVILTRTYPSNPLDDRTVLEEPTGSFLICWEEDEHDGEGCPAQGEGAHDDRHHGRDPEHGEGNQAEPWLYHLPSLCCLLPLQFLLNFRQLPS